MYNITAIAGKLFITFKKFDLADTQRINPPDATDQRSSLMAFAMGKSEKFHIAKV